jgi:hypothetical protein
VKLIYTGQSRRLSPETRGFIQGWAREVAHFHRLPKLFERELLFAAGDREYWLPVPNNGPDYEKVLQKREAVFLFITLIGGKREKGEFEWFFLVNKYEEV